ncbi:MAG TPA: SEFIR domain-containing protein [Puia sp.]|nr:SEFIR domain-containing protein [Puia sp.]
MSASSCRIFMSYAHDNDPHKQFVLDYSDSLINPGGIDCWIDRYMEDTDMPEGWPFWMHKQIQAAKYILVVCSPKYLARFDRDPSEDGKGNGVKFESTLMLNDIYQNGSLNAKFIPVFVWPEDVKTIPAILQNQTHYDLSDEQSREALYRRVTKQPRIVRPQISEIISFAKGKEAEDVTESKTSLLKVTIPDLPELSQFNNMKPGTKILQAFFALPVLARFHIAQSLGLLEKGESIESPNIDKLSALFLERAYKRGLMPDLWNKLFDEAIDPNPFKKLRS